MSKTMNETFVKVDRKLSYTKRLYEKTGGKDPDVWLCCHYGFWFFILGWFIMSFVQVGNLLLGLFTSFMAVFVFVTSIMHLKMYDRGVGFATMSLIISGAYLIILLTTLILVLGY